MVVVNNSHSPVKGQVFSAGTTMGLSVRPWITSSTLNLFSQAAMAVKAGSFTYTIPADSVVTFSGNVIDQVPKPWDLR